ncbi:MAG TPA: hypothetical protein VF024_12150 [Solirubrobacteraceae bacterium]
MSVALLQGAIDAAELLGQDVRALVCTLDAQPGAPAPRLDDPLGVVRIHPADLVRLLADAGAPADVSLLTLQHVLGLAVRFEVMPLLLGPAPPRRPPADLPLLWEGDGA